MLLASVGQVTTGMNHSCLLRSVTCIGKKRVTLSSAELYFKSIHILYLSAAPRIYLFDADFKVYTLPSYLVVKENFSGN